MGEAIDITNKLYPGLLEQNPNLLFALKCRQFVEMVNGTDSEICPENTDNQPGVIQLTRSNEKHITTLGSEIPDRIININRCDNPFFSNGQVENDIVMQDRSTSPEIKKINENIKLHTKNIVNNGCKRHHGEDMEVGK